MANTNNGLSFEYIYMFFGTELHVLENIDMYQYAKFPSVR